MFQLHETTQANCNYTCVHTTSYNILQLYYLHQLDLLRKVIWHPVIAPGLECPLALGSQTGTLCTSPCQCQRSEPAELPSIAQPRKMITWTQMKYSNLPLPGFVRVAPLYIETKNDTRRYTRFSRYTYHTGLQCCSEHCGGHAVQCFNHGAAHGLNLLSRLQRLRAFL